jgi:hypothetical protein
MRAEKQRSKWRERELEDGNSNCKPEQAALAAEPLTFSVSGFRQSQNVLYNEADLQMRYQSEIA